MRKMLVAKSSLMALACSISLAAQAYADAPKAIQVPAGELIAALESLATQSEVEVVYQATQLQGLRTQGLTGTYTTQDAVRKLLEGTRLQLKTDAATGAMLISAPTAVRPPPTSAFFPEQEAAIADGGVPAKPVEEYTPNTRPIPEILVEGARSLNADIERTPDDVQPYVVFDREQLEKSGVRTIEDFLRTRITASVAATSSSQLTSVGSISSSFSLRGLDVGETLILVDGRRKGGWSYAGSPQQPDVNGIPIGAVERIEVLPTTASGIYGGDATGGVINIVLRRDYSGVESKVSYDAAFNGGAPKRQIDVSSGFNLEQGRTNIMVSATFADQDALYAGERDFVRRARELVLRNNPQGIYNSFANPVLGATSNIRSLDGSSLTLKSGGAVGSPYTFVPQGYAGVASDNGAAFIGNAGRYNFEMADTAQSGGAREGLLTAATRRSAMATVRREFTPALAAYLDTSISEGEARSYLNRTFSSAFTVPGATATNPFNEDVVVTTPLYGTDGRSIATLQDVRLVGGVLMRLPASWQAGLSYTWERTRFDTSEALEVVTYDPFAPGPVAVADGTVNVFQDSARADFSPYVQPLEQNLPGDKTLGDTSLLLSGPVGKLPGGPITLSGSLGYRKDNQGENVQTGSFGPGLDYTLTNYARSQRVVSAYLETRLPLVSELNARPGVRFLEVQLAGRHDRYESVGTNASFSLTPSPRLDFRNEVSSTNPTIGLRYGFVPDITLRASYNTGFLAPSVSQLSVERTVYDAGGAGVVDPARGGESVGVLTIVNGSNDLKPEKSKGWNVGLILEPRFAPGLRLSVDWVWIEKTDNLDYPPFFDTQDQVDSEALLPGLIVREAPQPGDPYGVGRISEIHPGLRNFARKTVEAFDFALDYQIATERLGTFSFSGNATRNLHDETQSLPGFPNVESVDASFSNLRWQGVGLMSWEYQQWLVALNSSYFHSHQLAGFLIANYGTQTRVPSQNYHDLYATYRFGGQPFWSVLSKAEIQVGVRNVLDREPPLIVASLGNGQYYSNWGDPRLRSYSISLKKAF